VTLKQRVYLSRAEWSERFRVVAPKGELESRGLRSDWRWGLWTRPVRGGMVGWMWDGVRGVC
jgi:hypothetical protein